MRRLNVKEHMSNKEIMKRMRQEKSVELYKMLQCIHIVQVHSGISAEEVGKILGVSRFKVYRSIKAYNKSKGGEIVLKARGGRRKSYLSLAEEEKLLEKALEKAKKGLILTVSDIRNDAEEKVGHEVSDDYLLDLFHRHKWKKKSPRPFHPNSKQQEQEEFKKNSRNCWQIAN